MKIVGVIPARFKSSRFPGKPLTLIKGIPMIIHVARISEIALGKNNVFIATDDNRIKECVESFGFNAVMTSESCLTGTDRIWDFAQKVKADIYVNIQGDEPMLNPNDIIKIVNVKQQNPEFIVNGMCELLKDEDPFNINIPKVLVNKNAELIYMSRLAIPGIKSNEGISPKYLKQVCIYAFNYSELEAYGLNAAKAEYERFEDIEILRFFDLGCKIKMVMTSGASLAVDVPEDVAKVELAMK